MLREFSEDSDSPKIFAISLKAGGVGLNLTNANHVFMVGDLSMLDRLVLTINGTL